MADASRVAALGPDPFARWTAALEERHLANLRVQEVTRALRALSSVYVERRAALERGAALDTAGKRAAFALFYGPLHYLLTSHVVQRLHVPGTPPAVVIDLGCGTGAAGAAWAVAVATAAAPTTDAEPAGHRAPRVLGIDRHPWAVEEARWTYRTVGLDGSARRGDAGRVRIEGSGRAIVLAFTANELADAGREALLPRLVRAAEHGNAVLVIEPIARSIGAWWQAWAAAFRAAGGREDEWRIDVVLPDRLRMLDRSAGLDHRVLTGRSLYIGRGAAAPRRPAGARGERQPRSEEPT